ncbi:DNA topoisomerase 3 [Achromobacter sp. 2789STDY5608633]|jgi:DNA topoisomerase-3|uniref:DNA topoisomerase n=1 Tax=Pseudomonadota TaxID=1224 RepID=UPI0006C33213|nr:DNA topoisomerase [Achromobacter sp. 2789STDY5608633]CUJ51206.1 DNA topoisomerase 3 [Achromobacter sp. 2789STDY5608633]
MLPKPKTLWIPEKPSVGLEMAAALCRVKGASVSNKSSAGKDGYLALSSGDVICSVFGHMLQMLPPRFYLTREQNQSLMDALPLIPDVFKFEPSPETGRDGKVEMKGNKPVPSRRFQLLQKLIERSDKIVNACDIDREGQLIFDELLHYVGRDPYGADIGRISIVSMTAEALDQTVRDCDPNGAGKWKLRGLAAATRQKMDWLLGMNASMAYQVVTGIREMSVGRVQTPVLALVVKRDLEIENFRSQVYYVPTLILADGTRLAWQKRLDGEGTAGIDPNGRIIDATLAQSILQKIQAGLQGTVSEAKVENASEAPPLPFSMGSLQSEAAKQHGLTVAEVTKAAQTLYEKHKAITYVGTDCRYLPEAMFSAGAGVLSALGEMFKEEVASSNAALKSRAFNDSKIDEHFAIVPTGKVPSLANAEVAELAVYQTICRRYIAQFYPPAVTKKAGLTVVFGTDEFRATASEEVARGWKAVERSPAKDTKSAESKATVAALSAYQNGQALKPSGAEITQGKTSPPDRYTEDALIRDMENAGKFARSKEEQAMLKQTEGIGTARTREPTLKNLLKRKLLGSRKVGKRHELVSSDIGRQMIGRLPAWLTDVATTAKWETLLGAIERGEADDSAVLNSQIVYVKDVVARARTQITSSPK